MVSWCGREDSNLSQPIDPAKGDSDKAPRRPGDRRRTRPAILTSAKRRPQQLALALGTDEPRLTARRDMSAAALRRALARIGLQIGDRECLIIDGAGRRYDVVCRHNPLRIARRATLARIRRSIEGSTKADGSRI